MSYCADKEADPSLSRS